jgi:hypothetical protein
MPIDVAGLGRYFEYASSLVSSPSAVNFDVSRIDLFSVVSSDVWKHFEV